MSSASLRRWRWPPGSSALWRSGCRSTTRQRSTCLRLPPLPSGGAPSRPSARPIGAFLVYNVLFVEPRFTVIVARPDELVTLLLLLFVGIVIGRLAGRQRDRERLARRREREARALFGVTRELATAHRRDQRLRAAAATLASTFDADRARDLHTHSGGRGDDDLAPRARESSVRQSSFVGRVRGPGSPLHGPLESSAHHLREPRLGRPRLFQDLGQRCAQPMASTEAIGRSIIRPWLPARQSRVSRRRWRCTSRTRDVPWDPMRPPPRRRAR